jgi:hypothetical protein
LTIEARDPDADIQKIRKINETVHRLSGAIMGPVSPNVEAIALVLTPFSDVWLQKIEALSPLAS